MDVRPLLFTGGWDPTIVFLRIGQPIGLCIVTREVHPLFVFGATYNPTTPMPSVLLLESIYLREFAFTGQGLDHLTRQNTYSKHFWKHYKMAGNQWKERYYDLHEKWTLQKLRLAESEASVDRLSVTHDGGPIADGAHRVVCPPHYS